jgi:hypothetical protein
MRKPIVYIASPYTKGDPAMNTHFQCRIFDRMMSEGKAWPLAPLWAHFQHTLFPRPYEDWVAYDMALLPTCDACVRLAATVEHLGYTENESRGADAEVRYFVDNGKPVFHSLEELYAWIESTWAKQTGESG